MIVKNSNSSYTLFCDYCSNSVDDFEDFFEAVNYRKSHNWKSFKNKNDDWMDKCPVCQSGEDIQWV